MEETKVGVIYKEIIEGIKVLPLEQQAKIYNAIFEYQFTGQITDDDMFVKSFILSHKTNFDNMKSRRITNIENGKKGGAPKGNKNAKKEKSVDNYEEIKNNRKQPKTTENNPQTTLSKKQEARSKKQEIKKEIQKEKTSQPKQPVAVVNKSPQSVMCDYFKGRYKTNTGLEYLAKTKDYTLLAELIKNYGMEQVRQKIEWLEVGCKNRVFWFAKTSGINSFTIGKLYSQWNEILPMLTDEQRRQQEQKKKEEETMKRVLANAQKLRQERESWKNE